MKSGENKKEDGQTNKNNSSHYKNVLDALRKVNRLIITETDPNTIIHKACSIFVETRGYNNAWIVLFDENRAYEFSAEHGLGPEFKTFQQQLAQGQYTDCIKKTLQSGHTIYIEDVQSQCSDCPLKNAYTSKAAVSGCIQDSGTIYGILTVSIPEAFTNDENEIELFNDIANDIGFALAKIRTKMAHQKARKTISEAERKHQTLLSNLPGMAYRCLNNKDWAMEYVSEGCSKLTGYTPHELSKSGAIEYGNIIHKDDKDKVWTAVQQSIKAKQAFITEYRIIHKNNEVRWVWEQGVAIENTDGTLFLEGFISDITERKNAEFKLQQSMKQQQFWTELVANANVGVAVGYTDGRLGISNAAYQKITGYTSEELHKIDWNKLLTPPEWEELERAKLNELHRTKKGVSYEKEYIRKDGRRIPVQMLVHPRFYPNGDIECYYAFVIDISERQKTEQLSRSNELKYETLVQTASDCIYLCNEYGKIIEANKTASILLGWDKEEFLKMNVDELDADMEKGTFYEIWQKIPINQQQIFEAKHNKKNGFTVDVELSAIKYSLNDQFFILGIARDISQRKKNEASILERDNLLREVGKIAKIGGWEMDLTQNGKATWTKGTYDIMEMDYDRDPPGWIEHISWYLPEYQDSVQKKMDHFAKTHEPLHFEAQFKTANGKIKWGKAVGNAIIQDGECIKLRGIFQDISEQKQNELALAESERKFRNVLENIQLAGVMLDKNGTIVFLNNYFIQLCGWSREELLGRNWFDIMIPKNKRIGIEKIFEQTIYNNLIAQTVENEIITKNGQLRFIRWNNTPHFDKKGRSVLITSIGEDITDRKRAEIELKESELKFRSLFNTSPDIITIQNFDEEILEANLTAVKKSGYTKEELLRMKVADMQKAYTEEELKNISKLLREKGEVQFESILIRKDKTQFPVSIIARIIDYRLGKAVLTQSRDISEQKRAKRELIAAKEKAEESDRLKSAFLANMSHEIRTPMNGILGFAELLKRPALTSEKQMKYISVIEQSGERMLNIINDLIDISKIEAGQVKVVYSKIRIREQIEYLYTFFKPEAEKKGLSLYVNKQQNNEDIEIYSDNEKLYAILANLIKNAIKYTHHGHISFGYKLIDSKAQIHFTVEDTGIGIPNERQEAIFMRFVQADIEDKEVYEGAGLGLTICKAYLDMLDGKIWVESEEGKGSIFHFVLPFTKPPASNQENQPTKFKSQKPLSKKTLKILIAEDDETALLHLTIILKEISKEIIIAKTGEKAIDLCRQRHDIDLILMDIRLPKMDGLVATREIRKFNPTIPIIAQTAYAMAEDRLQALKAGCNDYLSKPINKDVLLSKISRLQIQ